MSQYAEESDLVSVGVPETITVEMGVDAAAVTAACDAILTKRSVYADGYLSASGKYTLPLTAWGDDLTLAVAQLAAWDIMTVAIGFDPEGGANANWIERRNEAQRWLEWVAAGKISPVGIVDSTTDTSESGFDVDSDTSRGW
jgi:phage gp36-like protein